MLVEIALLAAANLLMLTQNDRGGQSQELVSVAPGDDDDAQITWPSLSVAVLTASNFDQSQISDEVRLSENPIVPTWLIDDPFVASARTFGIPSVYKLRSRVHFRQDTRIERKAEAGWSGGATAQIQLPGISIGPSLERFGSSERRWVWQSECKALFETLENGTGQLSWIDEQCDQISDDWRIVKRTRAEELVTNFVRHFSALQYPDDYFQEEWFQRIRKDPNNREFLRVADPNCPLYSTDQQNWANYWLSSEFCNYYSVSITLDEFSAQGTLDTQTLVSSVVYDLGSSRSVSNDWSMDESKLTFQYAYIPLESQYWELFGYSHFGYLAKVTWESKYTASEGMSAYETTVWEVRCGDGQFCPGELYFID